MPEIIIVDLPSTSSQALSLPLPQDCKNNTVEIEKNSTGSSSSDDFIENQIRVQEKDNMIKIQEENYNEGSSLPWWFPKYRGKAIFYGNQEALGFVIGLIGRDIAVISSTAFLATTWLNIVKVEAGCATETLAPGDEIPECDKTIYGIIRPSSLFTIYTIFMGVISSLIMPIVGAVSDYTPHRLSIGRWLSLCLCMLFIPTIFISNQTWEIVAAAFVLMALVGWSQIVVTYSYLPELTTDEDELIYFTEMSTALPFLATVLYMAFVIGVATLFGFDDNDIAMVYFGQSLSLIISAICFAIAWGALLQNRTPSNKKVLPPNTTLWTQGFRQIYATSVKIYRNYNALKWFFIAIAFAESGMYTFATITLTYQTDTLLFSSFENGITILITIISTVPGAFVGGATTKLFNPVWSSILSIILIIVTISIYAIVLHKPNQVLETYLISIGWGLGTGWKWTCDNIIAAMITPAGEQQDAEYMGFYNSSAQILAWLPPILFIILNELYISQRIAIVTINLFFVIAVIALLKMGRYQDAVSDAKKVSSSSKTTLKDSKPPILTLTITNTTTAGGMNAVEKDEAQNAEQLIIQHDKQSIRELPTISPNVTFEESDDETEDKTDRLKV